ncbi:MAG TPA: hypothetical protein VEK56_04115 [Vicinamibacterales bacterium]|nr:hypothetical protein [Vicinamibacterales bacterium]
MAIHEADLEYGPTPDTADHEHTDIEPSIAWKFALWLAIAMGISAAIVYGTFWWFEGRARTADQAAQVFPLAAGQVKEPPPPHLQTQPFKDIYMLRQKEQERLSTYGWVDKNTGVAHIPIDDAMRLLLERGALASRPDQPAELNQVVTDSSAGRVAVPR